MDNLFKTLKQQFNYCDNIDILPYPSITPQFMQGYIVTCSKYSFELETDYQCCSNCQYNKKFQ